MMAMLRASALVLTVILTAVSVAGCVVEADSETDSGLDCAGNRSPQLNGPYLVKAGTEVPADTVFNVNETIGVAIDFQDRDCNLASGQIWVSVDDEDFTPVVFIPDSIPCSGVYPSTVLGFDIRLQSGDHPVQIALTDACGKGSANAVETTIIVRN